MTSNAIPLEIINPYQEANMIYVIDDDESVRRALERLLRSAGLDVKTFSSAKEFLESNNPGESACIILDIQMEGLSGFDVQRELSSKGGLIPVIVISASDDKKTREQARDLGAAAFFRKPVDGEALIDAIRWAMGGAMNKSTASNNTNGSA